jgi:predicted permease
LDSTIGARPLTAGPSVPEGGSPGGERLPAAPIPVPGSYVGRDRDGSAPGAGQLLHYRALSDAFLFTLVVSVPVLLWAELWRGQPMIDQPGHLWLVPAVITVAAFFIGGYIAGRHRRRRTGALLQGVALAVPVSLLLIIADIGRRLDLHRGFTLPVAGLWLYSLVGTIVISSLGALYGRRRYLKKRDRRKKRALAGR